MCLTLGLGVTNLFASNYDSSGVYINANNQTHSRTIKDSSGDKIEEIESSGFLIKVGSAGDRLSGNLSGVFSYFAGTMIGYQQAGGNYTIYDSYGARAVLSSAGGDHFTLQSFNFRTSDLVNMPKGDNVEEWNAYLRRVGFSEESLKMVEYGDDGYPIGWDRTYCTADEDGSGAKNHKSGKHGDQWYFTDIKEGVNASKSMNLGFFKMLRDHLAKGINYSASVSVGDGVSGLNLTLAEDGKQRATYTSYDGPTDVMGGATIDEKTYSGVRCVSEVRYDANGMQFGTKNYTFKANSTDANSQDRQLGVDGEWAVSYTFINFDKNGVRYDTTFNECTLTSNPKDSTFVYTDSNDTSGKEQTLNVLAYRGDTKKASSVTYYTANGSYFYSLDNTTGNITYFADNKQSYTLNREGAVIAKYQYTANGVLEAMWQSNNTAQATEDEEKGKSDTRDGITILYDYWGREAGRFQDVYDNLTFFGSHEKAQMGLSLINDYKTLAQQGSLPPIEGAWGKLNSVTWYQEDIVGFEDNLVATGLFTYDDIKNMLNFSNGVAAVAEISFANAEWTGEPPEDAVGRDTAKTTLSTEENVKTYLKSSSGYTATVTIKAGGKDIYQKKVNVVTQLNYMDPVVNGTFEGLYYDEETGKTYAKVSATEVNIEDGNGFQAADGETILVEVDEETANSLRKMKKGESVMFMGDVTKDVNGYMTMKMNKNYSGGIATGDQIAKLREEIQNEKLDWVKENTAANTAVFGNNGVMVDWKAGWNVLTGKNKAEDLKKRLNEDGGVYLAF